MGYRSDVVFALSKKAFFKYGLLLKKLSFIEDNHDARLVSDNGDVYFRINDIKWYDSDPDIANFDALLAEIDSDTDSEVLYGFMRLGEESGDVEEKGYCHEFDIYYSQSYSQSIESPLNN